MQQPFCWFAGEDVGHYGGSYKVTYDLYKKYGEMRLLDTPICGDYFSFHLDFIDWNFRLWIVEFYSIFIFQNTADQNSFSCCLPIPWFSDQRENGKNLHFKQRYYEQFSIL